MAPSTTRNIVSVLLTIFSIAACGYIYNKKGPIWFTWHPIAMIVSFILLSGLAILIKKAGGYTNTKIHVFMMIASVVAAIFGWYVIYTNKEMYGKPHVVSIHAKLGVGVCLAYIGMALFAGPTLNPDWGYLKTDKIIRFCHKWSGRVFTALGWICCVYGFATTEPNFEYQLYFSVPLLVFSVFILL